MKRTTFTLFCKPGLAAPELDAAARAFRRFAAYGAEYDVRMIGADTVQGVRMGGQLLKALGSDGPLRLDPIAFLRSEPGTDFRQLIQERMGVIGVGLTDTQIFAINDDVEQEQAMGMARYQRGALVTVSGLRKAFDFDSRNWSYGRDQDIAMQALELGICHKVGHILVESYGRSGDSPAEETHCPYRQCLMQENSGLRDFVERIVRRDLGFCRECMERMMMELGLLRSA